MSLFIVTVLTHTPIWVWCLLAALLALGLRQTRDHQVSRPRVLLQPLAMGAWSLASASSAFGWQLAVQPAWLAGAAAGFALNHWLGLPRRVQSLGNGRYAIGGSWTPLALILAIFVLRYAAAVALAMVPALAAVQAFEGIASLLYGLPIGLLAARAARVLSLDRQGLAAQPA